ncbi:PVC-type heme-binding CxxCH protein [Phragmitibacter flavus]|nr:PVC-type heme-binding CxxCH protein [Phragmitibacter flavus]
MLGLVVVTMGVGRGLAGDVKPVFESAAMTSLSKPRMSEIEVELKGARELYLMVSDEGGISCDWANWLEPQLVMADGSVKDLMESEWVSSESTYGEARKNLATGGSPLLVEGKKFEKGIGTHAASRIVYALPEGVVKFRAKIALDDGAMVRDGKPSNAEVKFAIYTQKPLPEAVLVPVDMFKVPEGLEVTLWAASPLLNNPTNMDFDALGRLVVTEGVNYRGKGGRQKEGDRVVMLEDTDGSGSADKSTVLMQEPGLAAPLGVAVFENKLVVSQPPDLLVYTDVNGDGKFDANGGEREVLLTGFNGRQHDHSLHSVTAGPDGLWYWNQGNMGAKFTDKSGKTFRMGSPYMLQELAGQKSDDGNVWIGGFMAKMRPDGSNVKIIGHNFRNSYEQTVTSFGDVFQSDNDDPPACRVSVVMEGGNAGFASADGLRSWGADKRPGQDTPTAEWRQEDPGTMPAGDIYGGGSPTGVAYYENGALGDNWKGLLLACEAGKNVVFGYFPKPDGAGFKLERFDFMTSNAEKEFAGSDFQGGKPNKELKTRFRPSDVCVGPDGAIYVADWFDARVGGHGTLDEGHTGAIYRIAPKGFKSVVPKLDLATTEGQLLALRSPAVNVRDGGLRRLREQGAKAVPAVSALLEDEDKYVAARAIWLLAQMGSDGVAKVKGLLESKDEAVRLVAFRALRTADVDVLEMARKMVGDGSAAVRREVALSLRGVKAEVCVPLLVEVAKGFDGKDRAYLEALGLGSTGIEVEVYEAVAKVMGGPAEEWSEAFAWIAWRLHPALATAVSDFKTRALSAKLSEDQRKLMVTALAFVKSREAASAMMQLAHEKDFVMKDLAKWWLMNRKSNDWKAFGVDEGMKALGLYDPDKVKLVAVEMPAEVPGAVKLPAGAEIAKLKGDAARGQAKVAVCYTCHKIGAAGVEFGPDLTSYGKQQPAEVIATGIAHPSADISHGFEGSEVRTKDGLVITGMMLSDGDPLIIKCMGGLIQTVPRSKVESVKKMERSLMYEPGMLGLDAQSVADIVEYLRKDKG